MRIQDIGDPAAAPIPDPVDTYDAARTAFQSGQYAVAVAVVAFALARLAYAAAERWPTNAVVRVLHLGNETIRAVLVVALAGLGAIVVEFAKTDGANWKVILGAMLAAAPVFFRQEPKGKPATIATPPPAPTVPTVPAQR
jgi:hypothetical protein